MSDTVTEVLKWIGVVFAAGFVGYFGRHLATLLIERLQRKKRGPSASGDSTLPAGLQRDFVVTQPSRAGAAEDKARAKTDKKRVKTQVKKEKKAPHSRDS